MLSNLRSLTRRRNDEHGYRGATGHHEVGENASPITMKAGPPVIFSLLLYHDSANDEARYRGVVDPEAGVLENGQPLDRAGRANHRRIIDTF